MRHRDPLSLQCHRERSEACLPKGRQSLFFPVPFKGCLPAGSPAVAGRQAIFI